MHGLVGLGSVIFTVRIDNPKYFFCNLHDSKRKDKIDRN